ncbi:MAG: hypothetical protein A2091_08565 [Desulfuromonadales bacterium GWD2_61_12]|nr:MAG: hypothetical protein A2005_10820 [Desulfuromonadales bacterium GWC2_61_20]OGR36437.1 MAG: hypothetical protein A2091_08565 [Desulfuromonadales bacterium GWD2_61_12]HAD03539.1 hypothetical protein [Desulfuromonas sp.]HBT83154.1 hypothetical protein [Desulfuromonas sp.]
MKRILVGDSREGLITTLEAILKHWGYRVVACTKASTLTQLLREISPDLLLLGHDLLATGGSELFAQISTCATSGRCPLIMIEGQTPRQTSLPHETLGLPLDLFTLFSLVQPHLEKIPRRNLRLSVKLPGLLCRGESSLLAEVLSLSTHGLFVKSPLRAEVGEKLHVVLPLMGMKQEVEIDGEVLYSIRPGVENNYLQGFGLGFSATDPDKLNALQSFIEAKVLGEVSERHVDLESLAREHLQTRNDTVTLRLIPS